METLELIDRYIDRQLGHSQAIQLEKDLQEDADLQRLLDSVVISREAIRLRATTLKVRGLHKQYVAELRADSDSADEQDNVRAMPVRRDFSWMLRIAASIMLGLFGYGTYEYTALDKDQVYAGKFMAYQLPTMRGNDNRLSDLNSLYLSGNYPAVIREFSSLSTKVPGDYFLTGVACLQEHKFDQAIGHFTSLRLMNKQQSSSLFSEETDYYLALAYLGAGRTNEAYPLFKLIHDTPRHLFGESVTDFDLLKLTLLRFKEKSVDK